MSNAVADYRYRGQSASEHRDLRGLLPVAAVIAYPFLLDAFHAAVGPVGSRPSALAISAATFALIAAFAVPLLGIVAANRSSTYKPSMRRLAYLSVTAPTLYVFLGVVNYMVKSAYPDELIWGIGWALIAAWAWFARSRAPENAEPHVARGRVAHGIVAAIVAIYVLFHIFNHLFLLEGPQAHTAMMHLGETAYRAPAVESILVVLLLFMCCSGAYLAWRWSAADTRHDFFRTFQIASGVFIMVYLIGHMDSVFIYARLYLGIQTDWKFAVGAPDGMIHNAWNIRLLPHYALGVFFVLAHMLAGLRGILIKHGFRQRMANGVWAAGTTASAGIAAAIIVGMCLVVPVTELSEGAADRYATGAPTPAAGVANRKLPLAAAAFAPAGFMYRGRRGLTPTLRIHANLVQLAESAHARIHRRTGSKFAGWARRAATITGTFSARIRPYANAEGE